MPGGIKVAVSGEGHAYMITTNNTLEVYSVSTPASPVKVGQITLPGSTGTLPAALFYASDKVYIATDDSSSELQIVDVSTPASPSLLGTLNVTVDGDDFSYGDGVWADASGNVFLLARDSDGTKSEIFMIDATDPEAAEVMDVDSTIYSTGDAQTPGGLAVGQISSTDTMCTTAGASALPGGTGYKLHCYTYDFSEPSLTESVDTSNGSLDPSRAVAIASGEYITAPGGKIIVNGNSPVAITTNEIYDISAAVRSGRLYAYLAVPSDVATGLKEIDIQDGASPIVITARASDGTFSGVAYDSSTSPKYIFGANRTGSTLGFVSLPPTPVGFTLSPSAGFSAIMLTGAALAHCDPTTSPDTDHGCSEVYTVHNVTGGSLTYALSSSQPWATLTGSGGTLSSGASDTVTVSIDAAAANVANLSEGTHTATIHLTYTNGDGDSADITRTVTLTVDPALGIKVRAQ